MDALTKSLNYRHYQELISGYFKHPITTVAYNEFGSVIWHTDDSVLHNRYPNPTEIISGGKVLFSDNTVKCFELKDNVNCYLVELHDLHEELIATIAAFVNKHDDEDENSLISRVVPSISTARTLIEGEYKLNNELNQMANELSDRYDELNMVYATDDDIQNRAEADSALDCLVENCCEYMGVPLSVLIVPQCNVNIHHLKETSNMEKLDDVLAYIRNHLTKRSSDSNNPVILNNSDDYCIEALPNNIEGKFISIPILTKAGIARGILACFKPETEEKHDFSNSDKNLLMTMVRKITKILNASFDSLTGLMSRQAFEFAAESAVLFSKQVNTVSTILYINIDKTQIINDTASHHAGDSIIKQVAGIIKFVLEDVEMIARISGDIFGVLIENCTKEDAERLAENIRHDVSNRRLSWKRDQFDVTVSIGVCEINEQTVSATSCITAAEVACDTAKEQGRNTVVVYNDNNTQVLERKGAMHWVNRIQSALREKRLTLFAQPIQVLNGEHEAFHYEILLRMRDNDGSILSPGAFMHAAELYHMMPELDEYVIKTAISTLEEHWDRLPDKLGSIAINLSGQSIKKNGFLDFILNVTQKSTIPAEVFCFEVTETTALGSLNEAKTFIQSIKNTGCKFSLDDFGTGLSSFSYLKLLPVDYLKIDGSFVKDIIEDPVADEMVRAIHKVGNVMNLKTIAEFVEDSDILEHLRTIGINYGQGYHIGKPIPFSESLEILASKSHDYQSSQ